MRTSAARDDLALVALLGLGHMAVDAATISSVVALALRGDAVAQPAWLVIGAYNLLAFATQPLLGLCADRVSRYRWVAVAGCLLAVWGSWTSGLAPWPAVVCCGLGNALFHVGAGALVLRLGSGSAGLQGLFIGPGDLGVLVGLVVGQSSGPSCAAWFALPALATVVPLLACEEPAAPAPPGPRSGRGVLAPLVLLGAAVLSRPAVVGSLGGQGGAGLLAAMYLTAALAKCAGGFVADRVGWRKAAMVSALAAALLLACRPTGWWVLLPAALVQVPTGITVAAMGRLLPLWPGTTFGLAALLVLAGGPPTAPRLPGLGWALLTQVGCAGCLWFALARRRERRGERP